MEYIKVPLYCKNNHSGDLDINLFNLSYSFLIKLDIFSTHQDGSYIGWYKNKSPKQCFYVDIKKRQVDGLIKFYTQEACLYKGYMKKGLSFGQQANSKMFHNFGGKFLFLSLPIL